MEQKDLIALGYNGMVELEPGQEILYKIIADRDFAKARVTQDPGKTAVNIQLLEDYSGINTQYERGAEIIAGANEVFWDSGMPLTDRIEKALKRKII